MVLMAGVCVMPFSFAQAQDATTPPQNISIEDTIPELSIATPEADKVDAGEILIEDVMPEKLPDEGELTPPDQATATPVTPPQSNGGSSVLSDDGTVSIAAPTAYNAGANTEGADDFFDATSIVPQGEMGKKGPIKVNPRTQPASKLVTVTKDYEEDTKTARIVSAERAMSLGMYDSALTMFEALAADHPREPRVLMGQAVSLQKLGRFDEAMQIYGRLADMDKNNVEIKINMLGLMATRYPAVALRQLLDLHADHPHNVGVTAQVAMAYAQSGDVSSAMRYFGMAASMEPNNASHIYNMAIISDRAGDSKNALKYYEQALEIDATHGMGRSIPRDAIYERLARLR